MLESEVEGSPRVKNSTISLDNSEDSDIFHDSDHDHFDVERLRLVIVLLCNGTRARLT